MVGSEDRVRRANKGDVIDHGDDGELVQASHCTLDDRLKTQAEEQGAEHTALP